MDRRELDHRMAVIRAKLEAGPRYAPAEYGIIDPNPKDLNAVSEEERLLLSLYDFMRALENRLDQKT